MRKRVKIPLRFSSKSCCCIAKKTTSEQESAATKRSWLPRELLHLRFFLSSIRQLFSLSTTAAATAKKRVTRAHHLRLAGWLIVDYARSSVARFTALDDAAAAAAADWDANDASTG